MSKSVRDTITACVWYVCAASAAAASGAIIGQLIATWVSLAGTSSWACITLCTGLIAGTLFSRAAGHSVVPFRVVPTTSGGDLTGLTVSVLFSAVVVLLAWLVPGLLSSSLSFGGQMFGTSGLAPSDASEWTAVAALIFPAAVMGAVLGCVLIHNHICLPARLPDAGHTWFWGSIGLLTLLLHVNNTFPLAVSASVLTAAACLFSLIAGLRAVPFPSWMVSSAEASGSDLNDVGLNPLPIPARKRTAMILSSFSAGLTIFSISSLFTFLMPLSLPLVVLTSVLTAGLLMILTRQVVAAVLPHRLVTACGVICLGAVPLLFPGLMNLNLQLNSTFGWVWMLLLMRAAQLAVFWSACLLPLMALRPQNGRQPVEWAMNRGLFLLTGTGIGIAAGWLDVRVSFLLVTGLILQTLAHVWWHEAPNVDPFGRASVSPPGRSRHIGSGILYRNGLIVLTGVCCIVLLTVTVDSGRSTQLLFSARSLTADRLGVDRELIPFSDASRLVSSVRTSEGEVQVWRRMGNILEFHRNGMSLGRVSTDSTMTPQPVEEILPAILPLVVHSSPDRILVLGDETGVCLKTCSHFPVQRIVAVRDDRRLTDLVRTTTWSTSGSRVDQDKRISLQHTPLMVAVRAECAVPYDVVISVPSSESITGGGMPYTAEFYGQVRSQLSDDGVFCQRFRQRDLGPEPLKQLFSTAMQSFRHVVAVQSVPGEIVLLAGNTEKRFLGQHVLNRLQQDFIRAEIATTGWDWVQVAILPMLDAEDPVGIFSRQQPPVPISIGNSRFAFSLPVELNRRVDRAEELRTQFSPFQLRLAEAIPPDESHQEIKRRLTLLTQQSEIMAGMPDEPWTYRRSLRTEMQRNPRPPKEFIRNSEIVRDTHPTDRLQQDYFLTLGRSLRNVMSGKQSTDAFAALTDYTLQHEPLLSFFAHYELVRLHEMAGHPSPEDEYRHRLHTVFFSEPSDASVRPVIAAMQQLMDQPQILDSDAERFDQLNSMLQKLIERWEARTAWEPRSASRVQNDVEQSVLVTTRALEHLQEWAPSVQMSPGDFLKRRRFIHLALTGPLRDYREQVLEHRLKNEVPEPPDTHSPDDMPLLLNPEDLLTN